MNNLQRKKGYCHYLTGNLAAPQQAAAGGKNMIKKGYNFYLLILHKLVTKMKKLVIGIVVLVAVFAVYKLFFAGKQTAVANNEPKQEALTVSKNSEAFNASFEKILNNYFALRDAITDYDTVKANAAARQLAMDADSLKTEEIKGDSTGTLQQVAKDFAGTISGSAQGLVGEQDLTKKKREFQLISEGLYNLVRTVKYDKQKLYHQHCPMAFNDEEEAWWISNSNQIVNPYLGNKHPKYKASMQSCGDITDSLDFSK
ncbi:MAG TPA: DUF3347 domain-containing protein [Chitinophagaceae bacterium]|nr:DUF3347 domain-containing protein [Chitinophagaceae bacterium]